LRNLFEGMNLIPTGEQLRAARAIVRMEQSDLASKAAVSIDTIKRLERTVGAVSANVATTDAILRALEAAGVVFIAQNGGGPGVRLRRPEQ
jgi:predicted transcriptional regulator